jgi:ubiquinone biosynthesis protein
LQKTMVTAEGVGRLLNPDVNMWQVSEPLIKAWAEENLSPRARAKTFARELRQVLADTPRMLMALKALVEQELEKKRA